MGDRSRGSVLGRLEPLLAVVPVSAARKRELCKLMNDARRHYHDAKHLALLWERHRQFAASAGLDRPDVDRLVGCAIAYHDAIYDSGRGDNEERSAKLWCESSRDADVSDDERAWIATTIGATADHLGYVLPDDKSFENLAVTERARFWMLDLDLTPLGDDPPIFDANVELLRAESEGSSEEEFEQGRLELLRRLDSAPKIFRSPVLASAFEEKARSNIARQLSDAS